MLCGTPTNTQFSAPAAAAFSGPSFAATPRLKGAPAQLSTFVGREREIDMVRRLLGGCRLLTLTGAGGSGKTRLAVEVVTREIAATGHAGVWVELAPVRDPLLIAEAVLEGLGIR